MISYCKLSCIKCWGGKNYCNKILCVLCLVFLIRDICVLFVFLLVSLSLRVRRRSSGERGKGS